MYRRPIYARIDYPDEDLGDFTDGEVLSRLYNIRKNISSLLSTYKTGRAINEGISTVICGKTNVGKSSFYNMLLGEDAAIVTEIEGTTRDVLQRSVPLGKVMLKLADTAGIREGDDVDTVERIGIEKSREMIKKSELLFAIFDISRPFDEKDELLIKLISESDAPKIAILNKSDKQRVFDEKQLGDCFDYRIVASVKDEGDKVLTEIERLTNRLFTDEKIVIGEDAVISSARCSNVSLKRLSSFPLTLPRLSPSKSTPKRLATLLASRVRLLTRLSNRRARRLTLRTTVRCA